MDTADLKILLALEPKWTVSLNGLEFLSLKSSEISVEDSAIHYGRYTRRLLDLEWLSPTVVRIRGNSKFRSQADTITLYPGERLPSSAELRRKRRAFQVEIGRALCEYFSIRKI